METYESEKNINNSEKKKRIMLKVIGLIKNTKIWLLK